MWPDLKSVKIHVRAGKTDMRKQIDGLATLVETGMGKKAFTGDLFLFCGRDMTMVKALYWDRNGFCLWTKRLERGRFPWPRDEAESVEWSAEELTMLLAGIDFRKRFTALEYQRFA
jgi:Transposase and inactivated derivatives